MNPRTVLFTGGCRSGKSSLAQHWAESVASTRAYVATSRRRYDTADDPAGNPTADAEMAERVHLHQIARGEGWITVEPDSVSPGTPLDAVAALECGAEQAGVLLFDCVTLWLSDHMWHSYQNIGEFDPTHTLRQAEALAKWLTRCPVPVALVTNELGLGLVPENPQSRAFRDLAGLVNQRLGAVCNGVVMAVCGQPLVVKGDPNLALLQPQRVSLSSGRTESSPLPSDYEPEPFQNEKALLTRKRQPPQCGVDSDENHIFRQNDALKHAVFQEQSALEE